jgi:hypothetical protein
MCRKSINFRGLRRLKERWSEDARVQKIDDLFGAFIDETLDECGWFEFVMFEIEEAQKRLHQMDGWEFDPDIFEEVLYDAIELTTVSAPPEYNEPKTFEHTLFASKKPIRLHKGMGGKWARESRFEPAMLAIIIFV